MPTAPTGLRESKKTATREAFLAETRDLLEAMPPSRFTVQDICDGANMASRSFHRYFDTKNQILLEVCGIVPLANPGPVEGQPGEWVAPDAAACALASRCYDDLGDEWLGAVVTRLAGGDLPALPVAAAAAVGIIECGQTEVLAQVAGLTRARS